MHALLVPVLVLAIVVTQSAPPEPIPAGFAKGAYRVGAGIAQPVPKSAPTPTYTPEARAQKIVGDVEVLVVVMPDGTVGAVRRLTSLDGRFGLDAEAERVAKAYVFEPGRRDGVAVPVVATLFVAFRLPGVPSPGVTVVGGTSDPPPDVGAMFAQAGSRPGPGLVRPLPTGKVYPVPPSGTAVSGRVAMLAVVRADGTVGDVRVTGGINPDVDARAMAAARQWTFEPAIKGGMAVPILMTMFIEFIPGTGRHPAR